MSEILVKEYRGNIVENAHRGSIAVVSSTGDTIAYLGDIEKQTFMRSASKPIQVLPTLLAGLHRRFNLTVKDAPSVKLYFTVYFPSFILSTVPSTFN